MTKTKHFSMLPILCSIVPRAAQAADCNPLDTCLECLRRDGCGAWSAGRCFPKCNDAPSDTGCYSSAYFGGKSVEEICAIVDESVADAELCARNSDCGSCVHTELSDGRFCQWFEDGRQCDSIACGIMGCGAATCSSNDKPGCDAANTCEECLGRDGCDAWSVGRCYPNCDGAPLDTSCFSSKYFKGKSTEQICAIVDESLSDAELCARNIDCASCIGSELSDGSFCQWFEDGGRCGSSCGIMGCGAATCS